MTNKLIELERAPPHPRRVDNLLFMKPLVCVPRGPPTPT